MICSIQLTKLLPSNKAKARVFEIDGKRLNQPVEFDLNVNPLLLNTLMSCGYNRIVVEINNLVIEKFVNYDTKNSSIIKTDYDFADTIINNKVIGIGTFKKELCKTKHCSERTVDNTLAKLLKEKYVIKVNHYEIKLKTKISTFRDLI